MTQYIRLRPDLSVPLWKAVEMMNTPVRYTCWKDKIASVPTRIRKFRDGELVVETLEPIKTAHQWESNLLLAEIDQNHTKCPVCGSVDISFKRVHRDNYPEGNENDLAELLLSHD